MASRTRRQIQKIRSQGDVAYYLRRLANWQLAGEISPQQLAALTATMRAISRCIVVGDLEERLATLEEKLAKKKPRRVI